MARVWTEWVEQESSARVWGAIIAAASSEGAAPSLPHAVTACANALSVLGAGLSMTQDGRILEPLLASGPEVGELDELQDTLGEGPNLVAVSTGAPVLEDDLSRAEAGNRWPVFAPAAVERDVRGLFAFPIGAGAACIGVLSVYRRPAGPLSPGQLRDALVFADALFVLALDHRQGLSANLTDVIDAAFTARRAEVHQAAGVVAAQEHIRVADALARLRARAYSSGRPLHQVATDVMTGHLRLSTDDPMSRNGEQEE
ncbi:ANTAR domain-containing protein [Kribbella sp. NPDC004875]|uniref:ANTAR domain-containing protein n=1 Tax=Kribbella sp. NPDC004875 TaxID=3364107 RepID=UPI00368EF327